MTNTPIRITADVEVLDDATRIGGFAFCHFTDVDVVRHPLVQRFIAAYERRDTDIAQKRKEQKERLDDRLGLTSVTNLDEAEPSRDEKEEPT